MAQRFVRKKKMAAVVEGSWPPDFDQFLSDFKGVKAHLDAQKHIIDAHIVDFFTSNHWETLVSPDLRKDLLCLSDAQLCALHSTNVEDSTKAEYLGKSLLEFIRQARTLQLGGFRWVKERDDYVDISEENRDFISHVMAPKKAYEVENMAGVVYSLSKKYNVHKILDLGSGKGYLSQALALQYGLPVVGMDSSDNNTQSAQKRNEKLLKVWKGLMKKSKAETAHHNESQDEKRKQHFSCSADARSDVTLCEKHSHICGCFSEEQNHVVSLGSSCGAFPGSNKDDSSYSLNSWPAGLDDPTCATSEQTNDREDKSKTNSCSCEDLNSKKYVWHQGSSHKGNIAAQNDTKSCEANNYSTRNLTIIAQALKQEPTMQCNNLNSFLPVTGFVDKTLVSTGELERLFSELGQSNHGGGSGQTSAGLFLIGLHTCGDLAPSALKLFTSEPDVKVICLVGCCYHLLTQKFDGSNAETDPGFPMSEFLQQQHFAVSRNATMIAQQAADRVASQTKLPPKSVLHRAILQVILKEKFGLDGRGMHVGKIASKCKSFTEYVRKGLNKLGMQDSQDNISDEEISAYLKRYENKLNQIQAFHQLRVVVSPCVESIFLMDRLCYLYEQGFTKAKIVRLFDPVTSPRCYAIIAAKDQH